VFWTNALQGFGFGLAFTPMTVLAFATLPVAQITEASGVFTLVRNFGSSLFISVTIVLLVRSTAANYARLIEFINPYNAALRAPAAPAAWNIGTTSGLMRLTHEIQRQATMIGYINAFYLLALVAAVAVPLVSLMRTRPVES
jgi:DHA2 family multidrug resistance protein